MGIMTNNENVRVRAAMLTRQGAGRDENQDRIVVNRMVAASGHLLTQTTDLDVPALVAVVDGLGGHPAGGLAASLAADAVASAAPRLQTEDDVAGLVDSANRYLYRTMFAYPNLEEMGATIAGVFITADAQSRSGWATPACTTTRTGGCGRPP